MVLTKAEAFVASRWDTGIPDHDGGGMSRSHRWLRDYFTPRKETLPMGETVVKKKKTRVV